ncbi:MAG: hypothetical protein ACU85E_18275 [Gammaproteobacteria bacterium]
MASVADYRVLGISTVGLRLPGDQLHVFSFRTATSINPEQPTILMYNFALAGDATNATLAIRVNGQLLFTPSHRGTTGQRPAMHAFDGGVFRASADNEIEFRLTNIVDPNNNGGIDLDDVIVFFQRDT